MYNHDHLTSKNILQPKQLLVLLLSVFIYLATFVKLHLYFKFN